MISWWLWTQIGLTGGMSLGCAVNAITGPRAERLPQPRLHPRVSLLIPARNEVLNLPFLLPCLQNLIWEDLEIILLDDHSDDKTLEMAQACPASRSGSLHIISGKTLPSGWLGKNWACHQLSETATGDILIFCDADARPASLAISRTVALLEHYKTGLVSFIPRQIQMTWSEKAVLPVLLHLSCCSTLPMRLIPLLRWPALGVANGQWMAFTRAGYTQVGGHASVRDQVVEDLSLARRAQVTGIGLTLAFAPQTLAVRMYRDFSSLWDGFGKNLYILAGPNLSRWLPLLLVFLTANWVPYLTAGITLLHCIKGHGSLLGFLPLGLLMLARLITLGLLRDPLSSLLWQPVGALLIPLIVWRSRLRHLRGTLTWKGRRLITSTLPPESVS